MADTAEKILDVAERLLRNRGYHGFSFQDISDEIGIRKPSLYYHFDSKAALGQAVMARYRARMAVIAAAALAEPDARAGLARYLEPMIDYGRRVEDVCLAGVAGAEVLGLPPGMQDEVAGFFREHEGWMAELLAKGQAAGLFGFAVPPKALARLALGALEGGLLIKRATGELTYVDDLVATLTGMILTR